MLMVTVIKATKAFCLAVYQRIKEFFSKPTLVVVDTIIPIEYTSAVGINLGTVSTAEHGVRSHNAHERSYHCD